MNLVRNRDSLPNMTRVDVYEYVKEGTWPVREFSMDYLVVAGGGAGGGQDRGGGGGAGGYRASGYGPSPLQERYQQTSSQSGGASNEKIEESILLKFILWGCLK